MFEISKKGFNDLLLHRNDESDVTEAGKIVDTYPSNDFECAR